MEVLSQNDSLQRKRNAVFVEAGGLGGFGSLNYERLFIFPLFKLGTRLGISTQGLKDFRNTINPSIILPISVSGLFGNIHHAEIGIGQTFSNHVYAHHDDGQPYRKTALHTSFTLGYRYQKVSGGFLLKAAYTPLIENNSAFRHWAGLSVGYAY